MNQVDLEIARSISEIKNIIALQTHITTLRVSVKSILPRVEEVRRNNASMEEMKTTINELAGDLKLLIPSLQSLLMLVPLFPSILGNFVSPAFSPITNKKTH